MNGSNGGGSINRPPILDGTNYAYWKARMSTFIKSIDEETWKAVIKGWKPPQTSDTTGVVTGVKSE